jgi:hypothetical protein
MGERFLRTIEGFLMAKKDSLSIVQTFCPCMPENYVPGAVGNSMIFAWRRLSASRV